MFKRKKFCLQNKVVKQNKLPDDYSIIDIIKNYAPTTDLHVNDELMTQHINQFPIFIINLKKDEIRRNYIKFLMKKFSVNFMFVHVEPLEQNIYNFIKQYKEFYLTINEAGCLLSHLWCLHNAIDNEYDHFIVFEDDIIFHKNFNQKFAEIINCKPNMYDYLMLGACDFDFSSKHYKNVNNQLYRPNNVSPSIYGAHAILYSNECAKYVFDSKIKKINFFDRNLVDIFNKFENAFICYPNLICSDFSDSHLNHNFSPIDTNGNDKYYSKCFTNFQYSDYHFICLKLFKYDFANQYEMFSKYSDYIKYLLQKYYKDNQNNNNEDDDDVINYIHSIIDIDFMSISDVKFILSSNADNSISSSILENDVIPSDINLNIVMCNYTLDDIVNENSIDNIILKPRDDVISNISVDLVTNIVPVKHLLTELIYNDIYEQTQDDKPIQSQNNKQNQNKQNQNKQNQNKPNQNKQNQNKQNQNKQNQNKQNQNKPNKNKQNQNKQNQNKPNKNKNI